MIKYILTVIVFSFSVYQPTLMNEESWNIYEAYKIRYKWLTYTILTTVKYNAKINQLTIDDGLAIIQSESNGVVKATSSAKAKGLFQIMNCHHPENPEELYDIHLNIKLGMAYYKWCLDYAQGNKREALRVYNSGPFSDKNTYKNYESYVKVIIKNSNTTKNLEIARIEIK